MGVRTAVQVVLVALVASPSLAAPEPKLRDVVQRMGAYIRTFEERMSTVVADERYRQVIEEGRLRETRVLTSDYALVRTADRGDWVGFRDTFEVDGNAVRDREDRLRGLVASGAMAAAERVANESARFNLGDEFLARNVNVPTFVLQLLGDRGRDRFSFDRSGGETIDGVRTWRLVYKERERPTVVRTPDGHNQPSSGSVWVDPETGEIHRTLVTWEATGNGPLARITVTFGRASGIDVLVPVAMSEEYHLDGALLRGDAAYSNFRQFQTGARVVSPQ